TFGLVHHGGINFTFSPTYSAELQRLLNEGAEVQSVEVINAGVIGYSTLQGLRLLKHEVRRWHPDVITIRYGVNDHWKLTPIYIPAQEPRYTAVRWAQDMLLDQQFFQLMVRLKDARLRTAVEGVLAQASQGTSLQASGDSRVLLEDYEYN